MATDPFAKEKGRAKRSFDASAPKSSKQKPPQVKQGSEMVKRSAPAMAGPKPPGWVRQSVDRAAHFDDLITEKLRTPNAPRLGDQLKAKRETRKLASQKKSVVRLKGEFNRAAKPRPKQTH